MYTADVQFETRGLCEIYAGGHRHRHCSTESALIDLFLLSKTKKVIGCRSSSFGRFGAWYGGKRFIIQDK